MGSNRGTFALRGGEPTEHAFVPIKKIEQKAALSLHRARQGCIRERTALANRIRGLLAEVRLIIPQGIYHVARRMLEILEDADNELPTAIRTSLARLLDYPQELNRQVQELEAQIIAWPRSNELSRELEAVPGIGPLTASALVVTVGDAKKFRNGRQMAAWPGLVPKHVRNHRSRWSENAVGRLCTCGRPRPINRTTAITLCCVLKVPRP